MREKWIFKDKKNTAVFTTIQIVNRDTPILYVSHDEDDGAWQFHDGNDINVKNAMVVALEEIVAIDNTIRQLADLPLGWVAFRKNIYDSWSKRKR